MVLNEKLTTVDGFALFLFSNSITLLEGGVLHLEINIYDLRVGSKFLTHFFLTLLHILLNLKVLMAITFVGGCCINSPSHCG
jgi:hypothetical protein